jgi:hypothetical protein
VPVGEKESTSAEPVAISTLFDEWLMFNALEELSDLK